MEERIPKIFEKITERYQTPIRIGSTCESNVFYRVDELTEDDLEMLADTITERVINACTGDQPDLIVNLIGGTTSIAQHLARELAPAGETLEIIPYAKLNPMNGHSKRLKGANVILVTDVITTARSCLEAHTKVTLAGSTVLCWCSLIDRTFGPGPVSVVAAMNGEPVKLINEFA